ncbi:MAG: hypothetical protein FJ146_07725 [Deltaproteobacteria bacterium]|nr:hypothetical protein [Deltaproteobacteria bacterium]
MARVETKQVRIISVLVSALVMVVLVVFSSAVARAEATIYPLSYSGRLTLPGGEPMQGPVDMQVKFWDAVSGGNPLASAFPFNAVTLNQGVFQIQIPTGSDDIAAIFGDGTKTVFIEVTAKGVTYPRQEFSYVPLALRVPVDMKTVAFDSDGKLKVVIPSRPSLDKVLSVDNAGKFAWESLAVNSLQNKPVSQQVPSSGQVLTYDGSQWVPQTVNHGGSVTSTSITAGAGLTGGTITTSGTIGLAPTGVTAGTYARALVVVDSTGRITSASSGAPIDLASDVAGVLPVAKGGTGADLSSTGGARQYLKQVSAGGVVSVGTIAAEDVTQALGYTPLNKAGDTLTGALTLGSYSTDPTGLQASDKGKTWFNATTNQIKYWDGSAAVALGVAGSGLTSLNGQSGNTQTFATPVVTGNAPDWSSSGNTHTLSIPLASAANVTAGLISNADYTNFKNKVAEVAQGTGIAVSTASGTATVGLTNTAVVAGSYSRANITVDAQGRLTGAMNAAAIIDADIATNASIAQGKISGLSTSLAGKENTVSAGTSTQYYRGDKSWQELNTSSVTESGTSLYYNDARTRSALSATGPITYGVMSGAIGITQAGSAADGYLSSTDWNAFNAKQNALGYTPLNKAGDTLTGTLTLGTYPTDPTGLVSGDKGKTWFNSNTNQIKYWDGSSALALGVAGSGLSSLNGQSGNTQTFATPGVTGNAPDWSSAGNTHTLNIPLASAANVTAGLLSNADYTSFKNKVSDVAPGTGIAVSSASGTATVSLNNTAVVAGSYTRANITVDAQGRLTGAVSAAAIVDSDIAANAAIAQNKISGLSTSLAGKENTVSAGTSTQYYRGDKSWQELNTSSVTESGTSLYYNDARARSALSGTAPVTYSVMSGAIGITQAGSAANGYLSSTDWNAFNAKQNALGYTPLNKAGDTLSGALDAGGSDISNTGNIQLAAAKTLGFGVYATDPTGLGAGDKGKTWYNSTTSQVKYWDGSAAIALGATGGENWAAPGAIGATTPNSGAFTNVTSNAQSGYEAKPYGANAGNTGEVRFTELTSGGTNYVGFKAPDAIGANKVWVLPAVDGNAGQVLKTDGAGNLGWVSPTSGTVTSVGITAPAAGVTVSGGPITGSGNMTLALANDLAAVENIATTGGVERTATDTWSTYTLTAAGKALLDDADATAQRITLGLGVLATAAAVSGGVAGTITDGTITDADLSASASIGDAKLATITTAGKVSGAAITSGTIGGSTGINTSGNLLTSGSVGIGTTAPNSRLEVQGKVTIFNSSGSTGADALTLGVTGSSKYLFAQYDTTADAGRIGAYDSAGSGAIKNLYLAASNVGIGTTAPSSTLTVNGTIESTTGGIKFPDGSVQSTSATGGSQNIASTEFTSTFTTTSSSWVDVTGFSVTITPSRTDSKILLFANVVAGLNGAGSAAFRLLRGSTAIAVPPTVSGYNAVSGANLNSGTDSNNNKSTTVVFVDTPGTTSTVTYKIQVASFQSVSLVVNALGADASGAGWSQRTRSSLTAAEISSSTIASSGSGTPNYVPLWNSTTGLGNSPLSVSAGNVGIGTTAPGSTLQVNGTVTVDGGGANIGSIANSLKFGGSGSGEGVGSKRSAGGNQYGLDFYTSSISRMSINPVGNVGIGTTDPGANLDVNGSIKSPMWKATQLMNSTPGALPLTSASFTTGGGTLMIFASGAGYAVTLQQIGMSVAIDNVVKGYAKSFTNETSSHKAFAANAILVTGISAGSHTITLSAWNNTVTNFDDFFSVTVLELPF